MNYQEFLESKLVTAQSVGIEVPAEAINPMLFPFQRDIVRWALRKGRAAMFEECGLGKTPQQLEWARHIAAATGERVLILSPLAVAHQTVAEGVKFGIAARYCRSQAEADGATERIIIANYEMLESFRPAAFAGVVLDESSILKAFTGKTKRALIDAFGETPYRLCCTATPAPNDHLEFGNHAEFLGIMQSHLMISRWFTNDTMSAGNYRLKHYAEADFWRWMTSWAVCVSKPSDLGDYDDNGFILPQLHLREESVAVDPERAFDAGQLVMTGAQSATSMWREKRATTDDRCQRARDLIDGDEVAIIWCDTNAEADVLKGLFPDAVEVRGSDTVAEKERKLHAFTTGEARQIITKPDIAGFGLNWQHCAKQVFVGVTYSFEKTYQALRRSWRYGQTRPVEAYMIYAETEGNIIGTLQRKQDAHREMQYAMTTAQHENGLDGIIPSAFAQRFEVHSDVATGQDWTLYQGDCVSVAKTLPADSIDFAIFSPPFSTLYVYTDLPEDMGNNQDHAQFFEHFDYLIPELWRITKPGRLCAVHCKDLPLYMNRDGASGLYDFPGDLVRTFTEPRFGSAHDRWVFHSRITIWKDPVIEMQRTKNHGLLWRNFTERGEVTRQGMADYVLVFRKWIDAAEMPDKQVRNDPDHYVGDDGPTSWRSSSPT
jgi:hypothetical protein